MTEECAVEEVWPYVVGVVAVVAVIAMSWKPLQRRSHAATFNQAQADFRAQREQLEAKFFDLASQSGKPRDLRWLGCDWGDGVRYAVETRSGLLSAFVSINIRFEAVEGGDMEDVEAVGLLRDAAALFHYQHGVWGTGGRALFNMNAEDAIDRLQGQFRPAG